MAVSHLGIRATRRLGLVSTLAALACASASAAVVNSSYSANYEVGVGITSAWWNSSERVAAYQTFGLKLDGYIKFDLSFLPDDAVLTQLTLRTYTEGEFSAPLGGPQVALHHVTEDGWGATSNLGATLGALISPVQTSFSGTPGVTYDWAIDLSAFDWHQDLTDNTLSVAFTNQNAANSYMYFKSSGTAQGPQLIVDYRSGGTVPEPEPQSLALVALALAGLAVGRRQSAAR